MSLFEKQEQVFLSLFEKSDAKTFYGKDVVLFLHLRAVVTIVSSRYLYPPKIGGIIKFMIFLTKYT